MKNLLAFFCCLSFFGSVAAQDLPKTYAIVVGISAYENTKIPALQFANRDAESFYNYLQSNEGGSVPSNNIELLINEKATTAAVYNAVYKLTQAAQKADKVYFYFSGHGDLENVTMYNNGFLICYNSPPANYVNMAFSIDYLNQIANTLSVQTGADVVLITDACHSGKITAESQKKNTLLAAQLLKAEDKEMRIASCKADELSQENILWGGGRGVFSYYLLKGMKGAADKNDDDKVSSEELRNYLSNALKADPILRQNNIVQTPVVSGKNDFIISTTTKEAKQQLRTQEEFAPPIIVGTSAPAATNDLSQQDNLDFFIAVIKSKGLEGAVRYIKSDTLARDEMSAIFNYVAASFILSADSANKLKVTMEVANSDPYEEKRLKAALAAAFDDRGQEIVNLYLAGDEAELEKRRYYNAGENNYDVYVQMFEAAMKLTPKENFFRNILQVKYHYFKAVATRLKILSSTNQSALLAEAFSEINKALALEENAANIYNELGNLFQYKGDLKKAAQNFEKAAALSPSWSVPQANLALIYTIQKQLPLAKAKLGMADSLCVGCYQNIVVRGILEEEERKYLFALDDFRQAIKMNERHFLPFEKLGNIYLNTADYALADSFYFESVQRQKGLNFDGKPLRFYTSIVLSPGIEEGFCAIDSNKAFKEKNVSAIFGLGIQGYSSQENAIRFFKMVLSIDAKHPLSAYYLGKIAFKNREWEKAEVLFSLAKKNWMNRGAFTQYMAVQKFEFKLDTCILKLNWDAYFTLDKVDYYLGNIYAKRGYNLQAINIYTSMNGYLPGNFIPRKLLVNILEKEGRFLEAEQVWIAFKEEQGAQAMDELKVFYEKRIEEFPQQKTWVQKLANMLYDMASRPAQRMFLDTIVYFPTQRKEIFIDVKFRVEILDKNGESFSLTNVEKLEGRLRKLNDEDLKGSEVYLEETGDTIQFPKPILTPRSDAIHYLKIASALPEAQNTKADYTFKIAHVYEWAGSVPQAFPYYEKGYKIWPQNTNYVSSYIKAADQLYKYQSSYAALKSLDSVSKLQFKQRLLLAKYAILNSDFEKATALLSKAADDLPIEDTSITLLNATKAKLSGNDKTYLVQLQKFGSSYLVSNPIIDYSMAAAYARLDKKTEAINFLKLAIDNGFNLKYVLDKDESWKKMRSSNVFKVVIDGVVWKAYAPIDY